MNVITIRELEQRLDEMREEEAEAIRKAVEEDYFDDLSVFWNEKRVSDMREMIDEGYTDESIRALETLISDARDYGGRSGNFELIPYDDFDDYIKQSIQDFLPKDFPEFIVIDWDATSDRLQSDYAEIGDEPYFVRIT